MINDESIFSFLHRDHNDCILVSLSVGENENDVLVNRTSNEISAQSVKSSSVVDQLLFDQNASV